MTEKNAREDIDKRQESTKTEVNARVASARKEEVVLTYDDLLDTIWNRIVPTLGRVTAIAIVERAMTLTKESHELIRHLTVDSTGISFQTLHDHVGESEQEEIRAGLKELVANVIDILAMLTGDILVKQLMEEIDLRKTS